MMNLEQTKQIIRARVDCRNYLQKSKNAGTDMYICPFCGSGTGTNRTGALKLYRTNTFTCFSCNKSGDVIDLHMNETGERFADAVKALAQQAGITEEIDFTGKAPRKDLGGDSSFNGNSPAPLDGLVMTAQTADYTDYYNYCREQLVKSREAQAYFEKRGIDWINAYAMGLGFDPQADPASAPGAMGNEYKPHPAPRIIIPTSASRYVGRSIDPATPDGYKKLNSKGGVTGLFQEDLLYAGADYVFVVEGAFDALSLIQIGKHAIALNSTSNVKLLWETLEKKPTESTLILCFDNDPGPKTREKVKAKERELKEHLQRLNVSCVSANISGSYKDANEALVSDPEGFRRAVASATAQTATRPDNTLDYMETRMDEEIARIKASNRLTGFTNLDAKAKGLYSGLYVLAAISSLGKTTLALQMADQIAAAGDEVLFFSMEQSRLEMVSKSIARLTAKNDIKTAVSALPIRQGYEPEQVVYAKKLYKAQIGNRLSIIEGNFNCDISFIRDYIQRYIAQTDTKPVVFIDYLQILQPAADGKTRNSKKDEIDLAVTELKRLSRELDVTVIVISSLNRANYMTPFAFESLKESGGIEYTADVVWGLQLTCLDEELFDFEGKLKKKRKRIEEAKEENPRKIKLVCLKNRYGISHYEANFTYYPAYDLFTPAPDSIAAPAGKAYKGK